MTWEICHASGGNSSLQFIAGKAADWSLQNGMQLNPDKTKEMVVCFSKGFPTNDLPPIGMCPKELNRISCAKVLGVQISNDLRWDSHIDYICPRGNQRLYFLCILRCATASPSEMLAFYN